MTIDEKLQHFYEVSVDEARDEASRVIEEHKASLAQMLKEHEESRRQSAEAEVHAEAEHVRREINKALSAEQIALRRNLSTRQETLKDSLFSEVRQRVDAFMKTPEYTEYLLNEIRRVQAFAGEDPYQITLTAEDADKLPVLLEKTGAKLAVSDSSFIGGIRAAIPHKNILIDNSFQEGLASMRREFKFGGGRRHE